MSIGKIFFLLACVLLCLGLSKECTDDAAREPEYERRQLVDTLVYVDTVRYYMPIPRDSTVIRYVTMRIPVIPDSFHCDTTAGSIPAASDSALVTFPVIQRHYTDSAFEAWVSGPVDPRLDSIRVYGRREEVRVWERVSSLRSDHNGGRGRWGIGFFAGYGVTAQGMQPCAGISVNYNLWRF